MPRGVLAPLTWKSLAISSVVVGGVLGGGIYLRDNLIQQQITAKNRSIGKPAIGGPFDLVDFNNKPFSSKDLLGKWALLYFGFTHCPDVCPEELEKITKALDIIEKEKMITTDIVPLFITVDPDRDKPEDLKKYLAEFSPKFIGLTGTKEQIRNVSKRYRVYYSSGPKDVDNDYIVDHTIISYLIDPAGEFSDYFGQNKTSKQIADGMAVAEALFRSARK